MKARVKATGETVEVINIDYDALVCTNGDYYTLEEIEGLECEPDYWTRLEHQAAIAATQGLMSYVEQIHIREGHSFCDEVVGISVKVAHALVEKLKEEKK